MYTTPTKTYNSIPLEEIKDHLRIAESDSSYDNELKRLRKSAIAHTEKLIGQDIVTTRNVLEDYCVYGQYYQIPQPNISIVSVSATTSTGMISAVSGITVYKFESYTLLKFNSSLNAEILTVTYLSGFATIPEDLKSAILIKIAMLFDVEKSGYVQNNIKESNAYNRIISSYMNLI